MQMLLHLRFLGLALFSSSALALTIAPDLTLTTPTSTNGSLNGTSANAAAFVCSRRGPQTTLEPDFSDCAGVLRSLPLNPNVGTFWNSGAVGDFQLPYFETYRTCQVVIELVSRYDRVQSSWLAVQIAALELNSACQNVRTSPGLGSAYTYVDDLKSMRITLKGSR